MFRNEIKKYGNKIIRKSLLTILTSISLCYHFTLLAADINHQNKNIEDADLIKLNCRIVLCAMKYSSKRQAIKELYEKKEWLKLNSLIIDVNFPTDLNYYYLGRVRQELGEIEIAIEHYRLAMNAPLPCASFFINNCDGFEFPKDAKEKIKELELKLVNNSQSLKKIDKAKNDENASINMGLGKTISDEVEAENNVDKMKINLPLQLTAEQVEKIANDKSDSSISEKENIKNYYENKQTHNVEFHSKTEDFILIQNYQCFSDNSINKRFTEERVCLISPFKQAINPLNNFEILDYSLKSPLDSYVDLNCSANKGTVYNQEYDLFIRCQKDKYLMRINVDVNIRAKLLIQRALDYTTCAPKYINEKSSLFNNLVAKYGVPKEVNSIDNYIVSMNFTSHISGEQVYVKFDNKPSQSDLEWLDCAAGAILTIRLEPSNKEGKLFNKLIKQIEFKSSQDVEVKF
jgi:hypothetical protein